MAVRLPSSFSERVMFINIFRLRLWLKLKLRLRLRLWLLIVRHCSYFVMEATASLPKNKNQIIYFVKSVHVKKSGICYGLRACRALSKISFLIFG